MAAVLVGSVLAIGRNSMGSPTTFSGFDQIDFGQILNVIMTAERAPLTAVETQRTALNRQGTAFTTLASKLGALESAIKTLADEDGFSIHPVSSGSPDTVGATPSSGGVAGLYEVVVSELARARPRPTPDLRSDRHSGQCHRCTVRQSSREHSPERRLRSDDRAPARRCD
jgi:flagellar capping protein FliD